MKTRKLGTTGLELTTIGFGAWAIGGGDWEFGWGPQDDDDSIKAIHEALDAGVNWIDTAAVYGLGRSEEVVGRAIEGIRDEVIVATKFGIVWGKDRKVQRQHTAESVRREVEDSLRRLNIETIDLYQMHWPFPEEDIEDGWSVMESLVQEGKIRYAGVSNYNVDHLQRAGAIYPVSSLQPPYSMLNRAVEGEILPYCKENNIGIVAYSPMQHGLLTGKFTRERIAQLPDDDFRKAKNAHFQSPTLEANLKVVDALKPIAAEAGCTLAQLALAWVLRRPEVTSAITGTRKPGQISETAVAADIALDDELVRRIDELLDQRDAELAA